MNKLQVGSGLSDPEYMFASPPVAVPGVFSYIHRWRFHYAPHTVEPPVFSPRPLGRIDSPAHKRVGFFSRPLFSSATCQKAKSNFPGTLTFAINSSRGTKHTQTGVAPAALYRSSSLPKIQFASIKNRAGSRTGELLAQFKCRNAKNTPATKVSMRELQLTHFW